MKRLYGGQVCAVAWGRTDEVLPGGRGVIKSQLVDRNGLWPSPESQLGHAPLPPRPFGRFGSNVAVIANR
jgi:hypothetical protein